MNLPVKLPKITSILSGLKPEDVVKGLPQILVGLLGPGALSAKILSLAQKRADAQEARTAGKVLAFRAHKAISAVAGVTPPDHRADATRQFARAIALQLVELAEELLRFADAAVHREEARGDRSGEALALADREAAEERVLQQGLDVGRLINGDSPQITGGA